MYHCISYVVYAQSSFHGSRDNQMSSSSRTIDYGWFLLLHFWFSSDDGEIAPIASTGQHYQGNSGLV